MKPRPYLFSLDIARTVAILGVVAIHVFYPVYSRPDFLGGFSWWLAYLINSVSRVSVPFFLLVSGTLLLPRRPEDEARDTLGRLLWRLGIPLVFWTVIYWRWDNFYYGRLPFPDQTARTFLSGNIFHLYFLVILFGLYLFLPVWRQVKPGRYLLGMSFSLGLIIYGLQFFLYHDRPILNFFTLWVPYLGYFLAGPFLFNLAVTNRRRLKAKIIFMLALIFTLAMGYANLKLLSQAKMIFWGVGGSEYWTNWLAPNVILMSLSGYWLLVKTEIRLNRPGRQLVSSMARNSFGIYLVHLIVIDVLDKYFKLFLDLGHTRLWWYGSKKMAAVFLLSWLISLIIRQLPLVRAVMGEGQSRGKPGHKLIK